MDKNKALQKIKKCLALAKSNNSNESAAALRQAQALMAKYGFTETDAKLSDVEEVLADAGSAANPPQYHQMLVGVIKYCFGVEVLYKQDWFGKYKLNVAFIGIGNQAEIALYAYEVLYRQLKKDRSEYLKSLRKSLKRQTKTRRADLFSQEWVNAVYSKVSEFSQSEESKQLVKQYMDKTYGDTTKTKERKHKPTKRDIDARIAGREAGSKANLHRATGRDQREALEVL